MDMEHQLHHLRDFLPQDHLMASSGFFDVIGGGSGAHFQAGVFDEPAIGAAADLEDCGAWVEDLMQLGDELFGAGAGGVNAGAADHQLPWQCDGGSPDDDQPPSMSFDADGSPPSVGEHGAEGELASEPHHDDGNVSASRKRRDRSKTIVSERKRRVRMKEKLYELRSLVPNITKMDKASIIADAVVYVKNLQAHARKLREEVAALEMRPASPGRQPRQQGRRAGVAGRRRDQRAAAPGGAGGDDDVGSAGGARVTHVGAAQVGEGRFFVTVECERRDGVAAPLCAAAESLACFRVESSSLGRSGPDRVVSTLALKVCDQEGHATIGEATVKLWVMAALLQEGFRPETTVGI